MGRPNPRRALLAEKIQAQMISSSRSQDGSTTEFMSLWKGIVHAHSTYSFDGQCDYSELRNLFRGAGLDFACMTEHIEHLDQHDIDEIIRECRAYSDEKFLFIPGIEMDCFVIFFLGIQETKVDFTNNRTIYRSLRPNTALCVLSHPIKADFSYPDWVLRDCDAVEVLNAKTRWQVLLPSPEWATSGHYSRQTS